MFRRIALVGIIVTAGLILVLLLAIGRRGPTPPPAPPPPPITSTSPEVIEGWELPLRQADTGRELGHIRTQQAVVNPKDGTVDVTSPVINLTRESQPPITITAPRGKVNVGGKSATLNANGTERVHIESADPANPVTMDADEVHSSWVQKQISTVGPVTLVVGGATISGRDLRSEAELMQFVLPQDVEVRLEHMQAGPLGSGRQGAGPLVITCAGELHFDRTANQATFSDDVRASQGQRTLHCDELDILLGRDAQGNMQLSRALAKGREGRGVQITEIGTGGEATGRTLHGSAAEYEVSTGLLILAGPVDGQDRQWQVTGDRMTVDSGHRRTILEGAPARAESAKEKLEAASLTLDESQEPSVLIARGEPAHAYTGPNHLEAQELHVVQQTGELTVPGPGKLHWESGHGIVAGMALGTEPQQPAPAGRQHTIEAAWSGSMRFAQNQAEFMGGVRAQEESTTLSAERMLLRFDETGSAVRELTAWNAVEIVDPPQVIRGATFTFDVSTGVMCATGTTEVPAEVWLNRDVIRAPTITYEQKTGSMETDGPGSLLYHSSAAAEAQPIQVTWQKQMTYTAEENLARFQDGISLTRETRRLTADRLELFFLRAGEGKGLSASPRLDRAVATGNVVITQPMDDRTLRRATGDTATWEAGASTVTLVGEPARLWQGKSALACPRLTFQETEHLVLAPGAGRLVVYNEGAPEEVSPEEEAKWQKVEINWQRELRYDTLSREARFQGDVFVREGLRTLFSRDTLTAYFSPDDKASLTRAVAEGKNLGDVTVTQGERTGFGTRFEWDAVGDSVELRGTPYALVRQGANEMQSAGFRFEGGAVLRTEGTTFVDFLER
jgi:LPS export ABC transporter protein LptC/lipopolysaccharide transport protein LptA